MQVAWPVAFTLFIWWFSTGAILYLDGLPRRTYRYSMAGATGLLMAALAGIAATRADATVTGACVAFACTIGVWAWQEVAFLMGYITGSRREACPAGASGWRRFLYATQAIIHHELALVVLGAAIVALTWQAANQTALAAFAILWLARLSSKLNLFLGVRNLFEQFLPDHLRYLRSYFRKRAMNALFPVSVSVGGIAAVLLWQRALVDTAAPFTAVQATFLATLLTLAILEHLFLVMPLPAMALWQWGMRSRERSDLPKPPHAKAALR